MTAGDLWLLPPDSSSKSCPWGCIVRTVDGHEEPHVCVGEQVIAVLAPDVRFATVKAISAGLLPFLRERLTDSWMDGVLSGRRGPCVGVDDADAPLAEPADGGGPCARCGCTDDEACIGGCAWVSGTLCSACVNLPDGAALIAAERRRQVGVEGYSPAHDAMHGPMILQQAGAAYLAGDSSFFPQTWEWKPKSRIRDLIRAGALFQAAAEIPGIDPFLREQSKNSRDIAAAQLDELIVDVRTIDRRAAS